MKKDHFKSIAIATFVLLLSYVNATVCVRGW